MKRKLAPLSVLCLLVTSSLALHAQNGPDNDANLAPGLTNSFFDHEQIDSINLYNGQLTIPLPMGPSYPIGPKLRMQLALTYNSRVDGYGAPTTQRPDYWVKTLVGDPALGIGWELTLGAIKFCKHGTISNVCYFGPDGSQHMFDLGAKTGDGSQFYLKGTGPYDMWDGDGNHYVFGWHVSGFDDGSNYTHDFGRGRDGWYLTSVTDPFGNSYSASYYQSIATPLWTYGTDGCSGLYTMQNPSQANAWILKDVALPSGNTIHVSIGSVNGINGMVTSVSFPEFVDGAATTKTWSLSYFSVSPSYTHGCGVGHSTPVNLQTLSALQLPSDLAGSPAYQFTYYTSGSYVGFLSQITLPTSGSIAYCYQGYVFYHASRGAIQPGCPGFFPDVTEAVIWENAACAVALPDGLPAIPGGCTPDNSATWLESELGVARRQEILGSIQNNTNYVQYAFPWGEAGTSAAPDPAQTLTVVISPPTDRSTPAGQDAGRRRAKAVLFDTSPTTRTSSPPPMPTSVPGDRVGEDLEERVFEVDPTLGTIPDPPCGGATEADFCGSKAVRVTRRTYEYDTAGVPGGNRRVIREKTIYGASTCGTCPYHQVDFSPINTSDWETDGRHYTTETHSGNLGGDSRTVTTDWAPVNWTSTPTGQPVLPNLFNSRTTTQGSSVLSEYFEFDTASNPPTPFLKGSFVWDTGTYGSPGNTIDHIVFLHCRYNDGAGNLGKEFTATYYPYPSPPTNPCSTSYSQFPNLPANSDAFGKAYTWQHGELLTARWINGTVGVSTFNFKDFSRDATTGWVTSSRDTSSRQTSVTYDSLGRANQITPPSASDLKTWVCYEGPNDTTSYRAASKQTCPVASSTASITTWQHTQYDGLGRMIREKRLQPSSAVEKRFTLFDAAGNAYFNSEWVTDATSETVTTDLTTSCAFSGGTYAGRARPSVAPGTFRMCFDPFGRPQQVVGAKMSSLVTVDRTDGTGNIYSDTKDAATTYCVNGTFVNLTTPTCSSGGVSAVTTNKKDAFGRITSVTEPSGDVTSYGYDVNSKLISVTQGVQGRTFVYDDNGFLRSETARERGIVYYDGIGSLGDAYTEKQPDGLVLSRSFDFAGRLVEQDAPSGTKYVVNCYDGAATCVDGSAGFAGGSYPGGKLTRRYGYNWIPLIGPIVDEQFTYGDAGGRLSQLSTAVGNGDLGATTIQSWTYNNLGLVQQHNHPRVTGSFPVAYTYANGLPTSVSGNGASVATAIAYNPAAGLASWTAGNGGTAVVTTITQDSSMLPRPSRIKAQGASTLFDTGTYSYDGAGNILSMADPASGGTFTYDNRSRLLSAAYGSNSRSFSYDRWGNLLANGTMTFQMDTAANNNHIKTGGSTTAVSYDARGNLTVYNTDTMSYDSLDRLYRNQNGSTDFLFLHNGAGERLVKFPGSTSLSRREMARLVGEANRLAGKTGWSAAPDPCTGVFADVPCSDADAGWIQTLYNHGTAAGCGGGNFCPDPPSGTLNRAQMATFVVKGYRADGAPAPACTGIFADVPCAGSSQWVPFAPYIEQLSRDNVTAGCGGGNFCPGNPVTPWQILVWTSRAPAVPGGVAWGAVYRPVPRGSIYTLRDEQNRVVTEMTSPSSSGSGSASLSVSRDNVFLGNLLVASNAAGAWSYDVSDHLGSPRQFWAAAGAPTETHKYWPYGEDTNTAVNQHLAFALMERNDGIAQHFDHARTHQYNLGRFLSPDRVGGHAANPQSWNRYSYTLGNPLKHIDPDGLVTIGFTGVGNRPSGMMLIIKQVNDAKGVGHARLFRYQDVDKAVQFALREHALHPSEAVVVGGHSLGVDASVYAAGQLGQRGVKVDFLFAIDPAMETKVVPPNVRSAYGYYQTNNLPGGQQLAAVDPNATSVSNMQVLGTQHGDIDNDLANSRVVAYQVKEVGLQLSESRASQCGDSAFVGPCTQHVYTDK